MTSLFSQPKFDTPPAQTPLTSEDDSMDSKKKIRKPTGRSNALLAGVANALKKRLGE